VIAACSKSSSDAGSDKPSAGATKPNAPAGTPCDRKLVTAEDVAGILTEPITGTKPLTGDPNTCYFITATSESQGGPGIRVTVREGAGKGDLEALKSGKMNIEGTPLPGVGDEAMWVNLLKEVHATKNNVLCNTALDGSAVIGHYTDVDKKLGEICNKIFAKL
jgi:hypothetical protein